MCLFLTGVDILFFIKIFQGKSFMKRSNLICYKEPFFCVWFGFFYFDNCSNVDVLKSCNVIEKQETPIKFKICWMHSVLDKVRMKLMNDMVRCTFKLRSHASKAIDDLFMPWCAVGQQEHISVYQFIIFS